MEGRNIYKHQARQGGEREIYTPVRDIRVRHDGAYNQGWTEETFTLQKKSTKSTKQRIPGLDLMCCCGTITRTEISCTQISRFDISVMT